MRVTSGESEKDTFTVVLFTKLDAWTKWTWER